MKRFLATLIVVLSLVSVTIPASVQADQLVSSDGTVVDIGAVAELSDSAPFRGSGARTEADLAALGVITEPEPSREYLTLKPVNAPVGIESVIGFDSRVREYTNKYPQRAIAYVSFSAGFCTGWFIGANTVVTAGHCVHPGPPSTAFYPYTSYKVYAGRDASSTPYGYCTAKGVYSNTGWTTSGKDTRDWGLIKLNCSVGSSTGTFGFFYTTGSLLNEPTIVSGYPGDKPAGTQWTGSDKVRYEDSLRLFYGNDTYGGQSGSPVWADRGGAYAMAVHAYGTGSSYPYTYNHGTRIDKFAFDSFISVRNLP